MRAAVTPSDGFATAGGTRRMAEVFPDFGAVNNGTMIDVVGALMTIVLVVAVAVIIIGAITWALSHNAGNYSTVTKAKTAIGISLGAAALAGAGVAWANFLIDTGQHL